MEITQDNLKLLITEIGILKSCKHPNIVEYIDSYIIETRNLWVVMEYMGGGEFPWEVLQNGRKIQRKF